MNEFLKHQSSHEIGETATVAPFRLNDFVDSRLLHELLIVSPLNFEFFVPTQTNGLCNDRWSESSHQTVSSSTLQISTHHHIFSIFHTCHEALTLRERGQLLLFAILQIHSNLSDFPRNGERIGFAEFYSVVV